jgi:hypothetical protein
MIWIKSLCYRVASVAAAVAWRPPPMAARVRSRNGAATVA